MQIELDELHEENGRAKYKIKRDEEDEVNNRANTKIKHMSKIATTNTEGETNEDQDVHRAKKKSMVI
jgi:hypothetical protein